LALIPFLNAGDDHKNAERLIVYLWILCKMVLRLKTLSADHVVIMPDICACVIAAGQHPKLSRVEDDEIQSLMEMIFDSCFPESQVRSPCNLASTDRSFLPSSCVCDYLSFL